MRRFAVLMALAAVLVGGLSATAAAHGPVDQQFEGPATTCVPVNIVSGLAQSFVPSADTLTSVDLAFADDDEGAWVDASIHEVEAGGGVGIGAKVATLATTQVTPGWTHIELLQEIVVTPGERYFILVSSQIDEPSACFATAGEEGYANGEMWTCQVQATVCTASVIDDLLFRTYGESLPRCAGVVATISGTPGDDVIEGTSGADVIAAFGGDDYIRGKGGADLICAGKGADVVLGGAGPDIIFGQAGHDIIAGGGGRDALLGGSGDDVLIGGERADRLRGQLGDDDLLGGRGNDRLFGGGGFDSGNGGLGRDTCSTEVTVNC